ncbi:MAG: hypothetical protein ACK6DP_06080 [Gemmatimonas sp.]|jgi:hypothetical protein|uniref:hypothetical protein n=1 Tax=Gemmatimonas sp. TaxID=1962908 RepID=UPI00391FC793|nr:hypothetical protein [Gemmatimonadota bacterium]
MTPIYRNTRALRVRFLQVLFWVATLGFAVWAWWAYRGEPDSDSWLVGAILAPIFALFGLGMEWYLRRYVTAIEGRPSGIVLETLSTFGRARAEVPWADVELAGDMRNVSDGYGVPTVDNSAALLRVRNRSLLFIDTTEDAFDDASLHRLLTAARPPG